MESESNMPVSSMWSSNALIMFSVSLELRVSASSLVFRRRTVPLPHRRRKMYDLKSGTLSHYI